MEINITTEHSRIPVSVMHVKGSIDSATHQTFQEKAEELIENGTLYLLIDFTNVSFISSAGLRSIHNIFNKLRSLHKDVSDDELRRKMSIGTYKSRYIKVTNLSPQIREVFELSGFETYIEIHENIISAVNSF